MTSSRGWAVNLIKARIESAGFFLKTISSDGDTLCADSRNVTPDRLDLLAEKADLPHPVWHMEQVHSANVQIVNPSDTPRRIPTCDGLITAAPGISLAVRTADCLPLLLHDPKAPAVAALHLGWRGLLGGLLPRALEVMRQEYGTGPENCLAALGPCICPRHYEVGQDFVLKLMEAEPEFGESCLIRQAGSNPSFDLRRLVLLQLERLGFNQYNIEDHRHCTYEDESRFYSNRRDNGVLGLNLNLIGLVRKCP